MNRPMGELPSGEITGQHSVTGAAVQWLCEFLGLKKPEEEVAKLAQNAESAGGLYLVPAFVGLGAPYWNATARGLITGAVGSPEALPILLEDRYVRDAMLLFDEVTIARVGIGALEPSGLLASSGNIFSPEDVYW